MKKSIIITGAGRGIGAATTRMFLDNGYNVGLIGRNADTLTATADGHPNALVLPCDVGVPEEVEASFDKAAASWGRLDVLFNNAGRGSPARTIDDTGIDDWLDVVRINLTGSFLCARAAFAAIMRAVAAGRTVINNGSISACSAPWSTHTSTKHAITGLTRTLSLDGRPGHRVRDDIGNALTEMAMPMTKRSATPTVRSGRGHMDVTHALGASYADAT